MILSPNCILRCYQYLGKRAIFVANCNNAGVGRKEKKTSKIDRESSYHGRAEIEHGRAIQQGHEARPG